MANPNAANNVVVVPEAGQSVSNREELEQQLAALDARREVSFLIPFPCHRKWLT
jgi:hypothetical protein